MQQYVTTEQFGEGLWLRFADRRSQVQFPASPVKMNQVVGAVKNLCLRSWTATTNLKRQY